MKAAHEEVLELWRGENAHVDETRPLGEAEYLLRRGNGAVQSASFPWSEAFHADLQAIHGPGEGRAQARERVGKTLRDFLVALGWKDAETDLLRALDDGPPGTEARITIRCKAGELCRLPLELVKLDKLDSVNEALGLKERCHVQWEWPETATARSELPAPREGGALLFAWSTAGGPLDFASHLAAIRQAAGRHPHSCKVEEVRNTSLASLRNALDAVRARRETVAVLHLLCHGAPLAGEGGGFGLALNGAGSGGESAAAAVVVDPAAFASTLAPYAGLVGCVVLTACEGANLGDGANVLGSVAQQLHQRGFPAVVASRAPLSSAGAQAFTEAFHDALLAGAPFHRAVAAGRRRMGDEWLALQVYARAEDGPRYPVVFRPYRGLEAFEAEHRRFFFGRKRVSEELLERTRQAWGGDRSRFQLVAGTSGSGKSSLVRAGLLPELRSQGWRVAVLRPGGDGSIEEKGLARLVRALRDLRGAAAGPGGVVSADEAGVMTEARCVREKHPDAPVLVVVDQLEEAFGLDGDEPRRFLSCLWRLARDEAARVVVLSTFRADLVERAADIVLEPGMTLQTAVYRESHRLYLEGMSTGELLDAIEAPLEAVGLRFEPGVAEQLRDDAGEEPGALPLLEHALDTLWRKREGRTLGRSAYESMGRLTGALSKRLDDLWDDLPVKQQRHGRRLLVELVVPADDVALSTRRRGWMDELRPRGAEAGRAFDAALEALVAQRLLVRGQPERKEGEDAPEGGGWVEIAHEALIRKWPRLQKWLKEEKQRAYRRKVLTAYAFAAGAVLVLLVMAGLAFVAYTQAEKARSAIAQALEVANEVVWIADRELRPLGGTGPVRKKLLERVGKLQEKLGAASGDAESRNTLVATHSQRGGIALSHDDLRKAREEYAAALSIAEELARENPTDVARQRNLVTCYNQLAGVAQAGGDLKAARELYTKGLGIAEGLAKGDPTNARLQRDLSVSYNKLAEVAQAGGDLKAARELYTEGLGIAEGLAKGDPTNAGLQRDLGVSYNQLAGVAQAGGDLKAARELYRKGLEIREGLAKGDPTNAGLQRDLSVSYGQLAGVAEAGGDLKAARELYEKVLEIFEGLAKGDPTNAGLQRDLSVSYERLAGVAEAGGDLKAAGELYRKGLEIREGLAKGDPTNAGLQRDLSVSYERMAGLDVKDAASRKWIGQALRLRRALAVADAENVEVQLELVRCELLAMAIEGVAGSKSEARKHLAAAVALLESLTRKGHGEHPAVRKIKGMLAQLQP